VFCRTVFCLFVLPLYVHCVGLLAEQSDVDILNGSCGL